MSESRGTPPPATATGAFSAAHLRRRVAEREAAKAAEEQRNRQEQQERRLVTRADERRQAEVPVYRFPNALCTDHGRRINDSEPDYRGGMPGDIGFFLTW